jgi:enterobactin synthetase component D
VAHIRRVPLGTHSIALPSALALAIDASACGKDDFACCGIERPPSLARSVPKRQAEYLAGRRVAILALREAGSDATDLLVLASGAPAWPSGFVGSISHTQRFAIAVALRNGQRANGVGIDIEHLAETEALDAIRATAVDQDECKQLAVLAGTHGWSFALTMAFSAKESFYKATVAEVGHFFDFSAVRIVLCTSVERSLRIEIVDALAPTLPAGRPFVLRWNHFDDQTLVTSCVW